MRTARTGNAKPIPRAQQEPGVSSISRRPGSILEGIEELGVIASTNTGVIPKIASRCAVFAKTDLIHAQQEGYSLSEICDGLCAADWQRIL